MQIYWINSWQNDVEFIWLAVLIILLGHCWKARQQFKKTSQWPTAPGYIFQLNWDKQEHCIWPKINYTYEAYEQKFSSNRFFLDSPYISIYSHLSRQAAYRAALAFIQGEEITVFYNPDDPSYSVLDTHVPRKLNLLFILVSLLLSLHSLRIGYHLWWKSSF